VADQLTGQQRELVTKIADSFDGGRGEIETMLSNLRGHVDEIRASWTGAAAQSFQRVMDVWDNRQRDMLATLANTSDGIRHVRDTFSARNE
jgi:WXG100 family type VII secretion target